MTEIFDSFAALRPFVQNLPAPSNQARSAAQAHDAVLTKPAGALGRLEEIILWLAEWQDRAFPRLDQPQIVIFAGNHGVAAQGVSAFPADVTAQMVANFRHGGAAINQLAACFGAEFSVVELALQTPTADFTQAPAMTEQECLTAIRSGWDSVAEQSDLLIVGEMGIGNTTSAAAVAHALYGGSAKDWVGAGTGVDHAGLARKIAVIETAQRLHHDAALGFDILRCFGGRELAAMVGAVLHARMRAIPVLMDGFITCAALACLEAEAPLGLAHCFAAHQSTEPGHRRILDKLGKTPLLDIGLRLGEGSGAATALGLVRAAIACHSGMATFAQAGVAEKSEA